MDTAPVASRRELGAGALALSVLVAAVLGVAVFAGDGADVDGTLPAGGSALGVLALALFAVAFGRARRPRLGRSGGALVLATLGLVVWTGVTVAWSIVPDRSWDAFNRGAAFAAFLGLGIVLADAARGHAARVTASLLALVLGATLVWALLGKAVPSLDPEGTRVARLNEPVDYWNALALLADVALVLGLWLGATAGRRKPVRAAGGLLVYGATLAALLTLSRAGVVAGAVVIALWLALARERRVESGLLLLATAAPAALVGAWAFTRPALVDEGASHSDRVADGAVFGILALAGAALVVAVLLVASRVSFREETRRKVGRGLALAAALAAVASVGLLGIAVADAVSAGSRCSEVVNEPGRLGSFDPNSRFCWWGEAWDVYAGHAPEGAGAGTFEIARKRYRSDARSVLQPHSVPLQQLADGGIAALALFLALVAAGASASVCALRRLRGAERAAACALVAAPAAYLVHAVVDYDWDFLAVTAPTMTALGALAAAGRPRGARRARPLLGVGTVLLAGALLFSFAAPRLADHAVRESTLALGDGDLEIARDQARWARFLNPLSVEPVFALARVDERLGFVRSAEERYVQAVELQPKNPEAWYALGLFEYQVPRNMCAAYTFLNNAYTLDPAGNQWVQGGELDRARDAVNAGACLR